MKHDTGKSCKLNAEEMTEMQNLTSDILLMERSSQRLLLARNIWEVTTLSLESITNALIEKVNEKERQSEDLDRAISEKRSKLNKEKRSELLNAAVGWTTGKPKP